MAIVAEAIVYYDDADNVSCYCTAAVTAGTFVSAVTTRADGEAIQIATTGAGAAPLGVALLTGATGDLIPVRFISEGGVVGMLAGTGGVTVGAEVQSDAAGKPVAFSAGRSCGVAVTTATAGNIVQIALGR